MNNRQLELYNYLLSKRETDEYISKKQICKDLPLLYPRHLEHNNNEGNKSSAYSKISLDIREINYTTDIENIVISSKKGFKIANNKEEAKKYIESRFKRDLISLKLNWNLKEKLERNNQIKFDNEKLRTIEIFLNNFE